MTWQEQRQHEEASGEPSFHQSFIFPLFGRRLQKTLRGVSQHAARLMSALYFLLICPTHTLLDT